MILEPVSWSIYGVALHTTGDLVVFDGDAAFIVSREIDPEILAERWPFAP